MYKLYYIIQDTKESPTNSYTMVNSDDNMGSGSSHKSDSLSNLDDSVEEESKNLFFLHSFCFIDCFSLEDYKDYFY